MSFLRKLLTTYRSVQNYIFGRKTKGVCFSDILPCKIANDIPANINIHNGDIVHPCIRFIPDKFRGHYWWMVYTPYYKSNPKIENPILCWGEGDEKNIPTIWHFESIIQDGHEVGYNSDPFLIYQDNKLLCFWRENSTSYLSSLNLHHGTLCKFYDAMGNWSDTHLIMGEELEFQDRETCPAITKENDNWMGYGMWLKFKNEGLRKFLPDNGKQYYDKIINFLDILGLYSQQKFKGVAIWQGDGDTITKPFRFIGAQKIHGVNRLYRPWHMDIFEYEGNRYMVIQTNQCNADICLTKQMSDGSFKMFPTPLITNQEIGKVGIYKPCAGVLKGIFFLYYTAQDINNRNLNQMYLVTMPFDILLKKLEQQ